MFCYAYLHDLNITVKATSTASTTITYPLAFNTQSFAVAEISSAYVIHSLNTHYYNQFSVDLYNPTTSDRTFNSIRYIAIGY